jgi:hypothetical protein
VELAGIIAGVLLAVGGLVVLAGTGLHAWVAGHRDLAEKAARTAGALPGRLAWAYRSAAAATPASPAAGTTTARARWLMATISLRPQPVAALAKHQRAEQGPG